VGVYKKLISDQMIHSEPLYMYINFVMLMVMYPDIDLSILT
jgi:hypothetical protein